MAEAGKILIVDDEAQLVSLLSRFFTRLGFTVLTATNGREGLQRAEEEHPDLVLLDIRMPGMDGMQVLRHIRARAPEISVIMITASQDTILASESMALGAYDYITKPIDLAYLEGTVLSLFPPPSEEAPPTVTEPPPAVPSAEPDLATASAQLLSDSSAPATVTPAAAEGPAALETFSTPKDEPAVSLAAECFRLAGGLIPPRLAREIEECALGLLEAVAMESDGQPHTKRLRLYLQVAQLLGGLTPEELARINTLSQDVEEGR